MEFVVAVAENDVIGRGNQLPWRLPADLRRFKTLTLGKHMLMGRKTYESIGRALPRPHQSRHEPRPEFAPSGCTVVASLDAARSAAGANSVLMVIGGAEIYRQCLPFASRIHLTLVHARIEGGDAFFDGWRSAKWRESSRERHEADDKNTCAYSFITLDRS